MLTAKKRKAALVSLASYVILALIAVFVTLVTERSNLIPRP